VHDFVERLLKGYSKYSANAVCVYPAARKQRLSIARALLKNPLLLLRCRRSDQSLDAESERKVDGVERAMLDARPLLHTDLPPAATPTGPRHG
jgi:ABC-type transport system involved in Fe-S cluster assembly fused permease/ATPase subunit